MPPLLRDVGIDSTGPWLQRGIVTPTEALCTPHSSGQTGGLDAEEPVNTVITRSYHAALKRRGHYALRILRAGRSPDAEEGVSHLWSSFRGGK
jgi:hypothetical protein